jgi:hypothetical protein
LFFEICVFVGNSQPVVSLGTPSLDRPIYIVIVIVLAFIIGNVFMMWVRLIQMTLTLALRLWYSVMPPLWKRLLRYLVIARLNPPRPAPFPNSPLLRRAHMRTFERDRRFRDTAATWQRIAKRILELYKIDAPEIARFEEWVPWAGVFGRFEPEDLRGQLMMVTSHAIGWSGIAAMHFVPKLHTRYFVAFCFFSIGAGLLHDFRVAIKLGVPIRSWALGARRTFEYLARTLDKGQGAKDKDGDEPSESEPLK